jgi:hypothetical protein
MLGLILIAAIVLTANSAPVEGAAVEEAAAKAQDETTAHAQAAMLECTNMASAETPSVAGPGGTSAVLRVETEDDHSKESHLCSADYELQFSTGGDSRTAEILTSDDDYGRKLTLRLSGFSRDGKRVIGILKESGKNGTTMLFDYHIDGGEARLVDLGRMFASLVPEKCSPEFDVIGTTVDGAMVVEVQAAKECGGEKRWSVDSDGSEPRKISSRATIVRLYGASGGMS